MLVTLIVIAALSLLLGVAILLVCLMALRQARQPIGRELEAALREELRAAREESGRQAAALREEIGRMADRAQGGFQEIRATTEQRLDQVRATLEQRLAALQQSNETKLDEMRRTVDEQLHVTLEKRLGESFRLVSERLESVQRGLGEMQALATGVGDLKRVLTNVKERGTWGEYQLGAILEQILTPDQFARNVRPGEGRQQVEFAIKLPGHGAAGDPPVWLPIDAKYPKEDYERLVEAAGRADADGVRSATEALARSVRNSAREIHDKYVHPPETTDFAILFLPTEGLYAEVLRQPGLHDELQSRYRVLAAGPTTLAAILNSLRVGFQTLAIERRSHEVWTVLAAVKTEFGRFGEILLRVKAQLATAANTLDKTAVRTRAMERRLRAVEQLPVEQVQAALDLPADTPAEDESEDGDVAPA